MNPSTFNAVDKLTASFKNFDLWLYSIKCMLVSCDLWEVCTKEVNVKDPNEKKNDEKAKALIGQACDISVYPIIMSLETAYETINRLKVHAHGGLKKRLSLIKNFLSNQYNGNMKEYVSKLLATKDALQEIGVAIEDRLLAMFMLAGLPEGFEHLVITLDNPDLQITTEIVVKALVKEGDLAVPGTSGSKQTTSRPRGPQCKRCRQRFKSNRGLKRHITMSKGGCSSQNARESAGPAPPLIKREKSTKQPMLQPFPAPAPSAISTPNAAPALQQTHPFLDVIKREQLTKQPVSRPSPAASTAIAISTPKALQQTHSFREQLSTAKQQIVQRYIDKYGKGMKWSEAEQRYLLNCIDKNVTEFKLSEEQRRTLDLIRAVDNHRRKGV